jgi:hypothetical protein
LRLLSQGRNDSLDHSVPRSTQVNGTPKLGLFGTFVPLTLRASNRYFALDN